MHLNLYERFEILRKYPGEPKKKSFLTKICPALSACLCRDLKWSVHLRLADLYPFAIFSLFIILYATMTSIE